MLTVTVLTPASRRAELGPENSDACSGAVPATSGSSAMAKPPASSQAGRRLNEHAMIAQALGLAAPTAGRPKRFQILSHQHRVRIVVTQEATEYLQRPLIGRPCPRRVPQILQDVSQIV